jgi:hypothetical protein
MAKANVPKTELRLDPRELRSEIIDISRTVIQHALALAHVADAVLETTGDLIADSDAELLAARATRLHGSALHGSALLAALASLSGRLHAAAWLRGVLDEAADER